MSDGPLVSVVMPVRNGAKFLTAAIESILAQTVTDFELLVIDNGSTDDSVEIVRDIAERDARVVLVELGEVGLVAALNEGLRRARGTFVARMDADDVAQPERLASQVDFLDAHPSVIVVGTGYRYVDSRGEPLATRRTETGTERVRAAMLFGNPIAHPSAMLVPSRAPSPLRYDDSFPDAEDFELWTRLVGSGGVDNVDRVLLDYRRHDASVTSVDATTGRNSSIEALLAATSWPPRSGRWALGRTFNSVQGGVGAVGLVAGIVTVNALNFVRPWAHRRTVAARSIGAFGSHVGRMVRAPAISSRREPTE